MRACGFTIHARSCYEEHAYICMHIPVRVGSNTIVCARALAAKNIFMLMCRHAARGGWVCVGTSVLALLVR